MNTTAGETTILVLVEGQTEETFALTELDAHFRRQCGVGLDVRLLAKEVGRIKGTRGEGGITKWPGARDAIIRNLEDDEHRIVTTMVDYYGLPGGWPGRQAPPDSDSLITADRLHTKMSEAITSAMKHSPASERFVPFVTMHEFEGLLFSDCETFAKALGRPQLQAKFEKIRRKRKFQTPEDIDGKKPPSKRIAKKYFRYKKRIHGCRAVASIGLPKVREECPSFDKWLTRLEHMVR